MKELYKKISYNQKVDLYLNEELNIDLKDIKEKVNSYLNLKHNADFFYSKRNRKVTRGKLAGHSVYIKNFSPFNAEKWYDKLKNITCFKSSAHKELEILLLLKDLDLPVVKPLLALDKKLYPFVIESTIITLGFEGVEAEEIIYSNQYSYQLKKSIMEKAVKHLLTMHRANIVHNDYRFRNILIYLIDDNSFRLALIDMEKARANYKWKYRKIKDWAKLIADWLKSLCCLPINREKKVSLIKEEFNKYKNVVIEEYKINSLQLKLFNKWVNRIFDDQINIRSC